ncbi:serine hydrolase domain-containing protein [Curtobacterium poinsettiae]|uniref:Serine hydrolase n=1 Tax=Curtobacterium poinsettiae TaxID=159612 RepID=A0ABT3S5F4_9MICO|nr:serine hydrolase domain-containing protein [Curtobacterium flaccumfaciens]MBT1610058.1 serine hydrolase [Curtobacterium flaccumfaciens pv. poinsettiae]MCX2850058.1 serine hydrolase [Curtobacterium flaccumfaciens pv. poinsettiae]UXN19659.1 beta-lactamase family protein [Curtobacterium flaccumfaciens pv. poinsettiae]
MHTAATILDAVVAHVDATGFAAHGIHVRTRTGATDTDDVAEHRWTPDVRREVHSVAKGVCVVAAGIAADDGLVDVDEPIAGYLTGTGLALGDGVDRVTLRHLLTMTSGIDMPWSATELTDWPDLAAEFLRRPSRGRVFQYANASTYTAMRVLETRVGDVGAFVAERLFAPLGIQDVDWQRCPNGFVAGGEGLALRTEEIARLGRLIRNRGMVDGQRMVSARWCDAMHTDWVEREGTGPGYERYAMAGWGGPGRLWRLHGAYGQMLLFDQTEGDTGTVVTVTADDHPGADALAAFVADELSRQASRR